MGWLRSRSGSRSCVRLTNRLDREAKREAKVRGLPEKACSNPRAYRVSGFHSLRERVRALPCTRGDHHLEPPAPNEPKLVPGGASAPNEPKLVPGGASAPNELS